MIAPFLRGCQCKIPRPLSSVAAIGTDPGETERIHGWGGCHGILGLFKGRRDPEGGGPLNRKKNYLLKKTL